MSDTPETDALLKQCKIKGRNPDPWKLCRKLERERNSLQDQRDFAMGEIERLRKERDEANKELHKQLEKYDALFDEAEKIRMERDEAREALDAVMGWAALKVLEATK